MVEGVRRQWRWYRVKGAPSAIAKDEFDALPVHGQAALVDVMKRYQRDELLSGEIKSINDVPGLYELRVQVGRDPFRLLFFRDSPDHAIAVLAVYKNQRKLPKADRDKAAKRLKDWRSGGK